MLSWQYKACCASGHFFRLDLRCHHLGYIALGEPDAGKKKSHDITVIKRSTPETLRNGAGKGRKVIYAWNKACIDYHLWHRLKHNNGVYFIQQSHKGTDKIYKSACFGSPGG